MYPIINVFGLKLQSYYVCAALAASAGLLLSCAMLKKILTKKQAVLLPVLTMLSALVGARLLNYITNPNAFGSDFPIWTLSYRKLSLMGGLVAGVVTIFVFCLINKLSITAVLDAFVVPAAAGIMLLKLGCFLNGCCFGIPTDGPFGVVFPSNAPMYDILSTLHIIKVKSPKVHPAQLYELVGAAFSAGMAYLISKKFKLKTGSISAIFIMLFSTCRWIVLPLRELPYDKAVISEFYPCLYAILILFGVLQLWQNSRK